MKNILIVCKGNICRSPLAHGMLDQKGQANKINWAIDSAGTGHWHIGKLPDSRSIAVADRHGLDITYQRARQFHCKDFDRFDTIYVMDKQNYGVLFELSEGPDQIAKVSLIMNEIEPGSDSDVPDPFHDGVENFEKVYKVLDKVTDAIVQKAKSN